MLSCQHERKDINTIDSMMCENVNKDTQKEADEYSPTASKSLYCHIVYNWKNIKQNSHKQSYIHAVKQNPFFPSNP